MSLKRQASSDDEPWKPSFDLKAFKRVLDRSDNVTILIKGHLYIEHVLIHFIEAALPMKGVLKIDGLRFPTKVDLAVALSCVPVQISEMLKYVNSLRNRVAHELAADISEAQKQELFNKLPAPVQAICLKDMADKPREVAVAELEFKRLFQIIVLLLDTQRHSFEAQLKKKAAAERELALAVEDYERELGLRD